MTLAELPWLQLASPMVLLQLSSSSVRSKLADAVRRQLLTYNNYKGSKPEPGHWPGFFITVLRGQERRYPGI
jgi:hypothetical protein